MLDSGELLLIAVLLPLSSTVLHRAIAANLVRFAGKCQEVTPIQSLLMQPNLFPEQRNVYQQSMVTVPSIEAQSSSRRGRLQRMVGSVLLTCSVLLSLSACAAGKQASPQEGEEFSYAWLKGYARTMAAQPYESHKGELPKSLQGMSWDDYQP